MASSLITKKRIAKAFRDLLATREFDKISIVDIMESAGIRRQTFYNHFLVIDTFGKEFVIAKNFYQL